MGLDFQYRIGQQRINRDAIMHKKHRVSLRCLLMAASFILSPSLTNLRAAESGTNLSSLEAENGPRIPTLNPAMAKSSENDGEALKAKKMTQGAMFLVAEGKASYYSNRFHGRKTASGEHFDRRDFTAAHRSLPFGTKVCVTNLENGKRVVVKINDRGPHLRNRIIDISQAAARELGMMNSGISNVRIEAYN